MNACIQCDLIITDKVFRYSLDAIGHPLCFDCQRWFRNILDYTTASDEAIDLYFALRNRNIPAQLEKCDGYKTIDIAIPSSKINIEVDGMHHSYNPAQALSDLKRTYASFKKGYFTIRIPNSLVHTNLEEAANLIAAFVDSGR